MSWNFAVFVTACVAIVAIVAALIYCVVRTLSSSTPAKTAVLITAISGLVGAIATIIYAIGGVQGPPASVVDPLPAASSTTSGHGSW